MDPAALAALQEKIGEKRKEAPSSAAAAGALTSPELLTGLESNASVLNATNAALLPSVLSLPAPESAPVPLKSDADEQLLVGMTLAQTFKLTAITIVGPADGSAPKTVKIFANKPSMSFDDCEDFAPTQTLTFSSASGTQPLALTKFSAVSSLSIFVEDNQAGGEVTALSRIELTGVPLATTNMKDLKKAG